IMHLAMKTISALSTYRSALPAAILCGVLLGCAGSLVSAQSVKIYKNRGAVQCGSPGLSLEEMGKTLTGRNVKVLAAFCANDRALRTAVCGSDAGLFNVYEIDAAGLSNATALGFAELEKLGRYREAPCPAPGDGAGRSMRAD